MQKALMFFLVCAAVAVSPSAASADDSWTHTVTFHNSSAASLKVVSPADFAVSIDVAGEAQRDTVPAIFSLPNRDAYVKVVLTAPDGAQWKEKIEVRAYRRTELSVTYRPKKKEAARSTATFIGTVGNSASGCGKKHKPEVRFDFLRKSDRTVVESIELRDQSAKQIELPEADYDLRLFLREGGASTFTFYKTVTLAVAKDDWMVAYGCKAGSRKADIHIK